MEIKHILARLFYTNTYILKDESTGKCTVIDPGEASEDILTSCREAGLENIEYILLTHGHFDHIFGVDELSKLTGAKLVISKEDAELLSDARKNAGWLVGMDVICNKTPDILVSDGDELVLGGLTIKVMSTPGHSKGSVCYFCENAIFAGDTVFCCGHGRTDLYSGSEEELAKSLKKLADVEGNLDIYPGHDIKTTLEYERKHNPMMKMR